MLHDLRRLLGFDIFGQRDLEDGALGDELRRVEQQPLRDQLGSNALKSVQVRPAYLFNGFLCFRKLFRLGLSASGLFLGLGKVLLLFFLQIVLRDKSCLVGFRTHARRVLGKGVDLRAAQPPSIGVCEFLVTGDRTEPSKLHAKDAASGRQKAALS